MRHALHFIFHAFIAVVIAYGIGWVVEQFIHYPPAQLTALILLVGYVAYLIYKRFAAGHPHWRTTFFKWAWLAASVLFLFLATDGMQISMVPTLVTQVGQNMEVARTGNPAYQRLYNLITDFEPRTDYRSETIRNSKQYIAYEELGWFRLFLFSLIPTLYFWWGPLTKLFGSATSAAGGAGH